MRDALDATDLVEHFLRPLSAPVVRADLCHAVSNGLPALLALVAKWQHGTPMVMSRARRLPARALPGLPGRPLLLAGQGRPARAVPPGVLDGVRRGRPHRAGQRLQPALGGAARRRPRRHRHRLQRGERRTPTPRPTASPRCRRSAGSAGSTRSRTSRPWCAPSRSCASAAPTPSCACSARPRRATRRTRREVRALVDELGLDERRHLRGTGPAGDGGLPRLHGRGAVEHLRGPAVHRHGGDDVPPRHRLHRRRRGAARWSGTPASSSRRATRGPSRTPACACSTTPSSGTGSPPRRGSGRSRSSSSSACCRPSPACTPTCSAP